MEDKPGRDAPADLEPPMLMAAELSAVLAESEAEAEAGLFVSGDDILRELHESIARLEGGDVAADDAGMESGHSPRR